MASGATNVVSFYRSSAEPDTGGPTGALPKLSRTGASDTDPTPSLSLPGSDRRSQGGQIFTLQDLGNGVAFLHPLYLSADFAGDEWFITSPDLALVARGESVLEALDDIREQIAELFDSLRQMRESLGPRLRNQLGFLERLAGAR
jgi:predicted RNase H-like HicB family nuclease